MKMLQFLMGGYYITLLVLLLITMALGVLMFRLCRKILRRVSKDMSHRAVNTWSTLGALPLTTAMGIVPYIMYISIEELPEELEASHYAIMEEELARDLKVGTSRKRIIELFGEADTTQSTMIYNLSLPEAINKYVLELHFDEHGLASFRRQASDSTPQLNK